MKYRSPDTKIFPKVKKFSEKYHQWRKEILSFIKENQAIFRIAPSDKSLNEFRNFLDKDISALFIVSRILSVKYEDPDHGNPKNPLDNLIYILFSRRTRKSGYQKVFKDIKEKFNSWDEVEKAKNEELLEIIKPSGMATHKLAGLKAILNASRERFGEITLDPLANWPNDEIEAFLTSIPHIDRKSALCVMMYSLGRKVFPADANVNRILIRMNIFKNIGYIPSKTNHRLNQRILSKLIPTSIRFALHVNLVAHGGEMCVPWFSSCKCPICEVRKFCEAFRSSEQLKNNESDKPKFIDLFAGAGGMSEGFKRAGFLPLAAVEYKDSAAKTYALNHPEVPDENVYVEGIADCIEDIIKKFKNRNIDVIVGGPPCQSYSRVGYKSKPKYQHLHKNDERNELFRYMLDLSASLKPTIVLLENVPSIGDKHGDNLPYLQKICHELKKIGYSPQVIKFNAAEVWVPQNRTRTFIVATIDGRPVSKPTSACLEPLKNQSRQMQLFPEGFNKPISLIEAIGDLPEIPAGEEIWIRSKVNDENEENRYLDLKRIRDGSIIVFNHVTRSHNASDLELYSLLKPGETARDAIEKYNRPDLMKYKMNSFEDKYRKLEPDKPCYTLVAHLRKDGNSFIHPFQIRDLSVREAARLQSFPDSYIFTGSRGDQFEQIGNAVPPLMAEAIARTLMVALRDRKVN